MARCLLIFAGMRSVVILCVGTLLSVGAVATAKPTGPQILCETWPDIDGCRGRTPSCSACHTSTWPAAWNDFGVDLLVSLNGAVFEDALPAALEAVAGNDPDGDGVASRTELEQGTDAGSSLSVGGYGPAFGAQPNPWYAVDGYDASFAFRRVMLVFCGRSPSYEERQAFEGDSPDLATLNTRLHDQLSTCLEGEYWRQVQVPRMAHRRIRPVREVGADTTVDIVIGDYEWDYRLFRYILTGGRDLRDLLTADYHVDEVNGELVVVEGPIAPTGSPASGNPLPVDRRAGMLTTRWFFAINTMFSELPRTAAAQAYREYLGMDLAQSEGIIPVSGEPLDVDGKGVAAAPCSHCHSTLDPLSYAFAEYRGINGSETGLYDANRPASLMPGWADPDTVLLGEPVDDLVAWAHQAAESEAFRRTMVEMLFALVLDREPEWDEVAEVAALADALPNAGGSADALLHLLIDTQAFGAP